MKLCSSWLERKEMLLEPYRQGKRHGLDITDESEKSLRVWWAIGKKVCDRYSKLKSLSISQRLSLDEKILFGKITHL